MNRRPRSPEHLPRNLRTFDRSQWQGRDDAEAYGEFVGAREAWKDVNGIESLPDDAAVWAAFPDGTWEVWGAL